nr:MAG TPA: hypothetical protein [Caudoviricetes sp.]
MRRRISSRNNQCNRPISIWWRLQSWFVVPTQFCKESIYQAGTS